MTYYIKTKWGHAKKTINMAGRINDSKFEAGIANDLYLMKKAGEIIDYEEQVVIPLIVNNYEICKYKIDFVVYRNEETEYIEAKGYPGEVWKLKWKLFEALFTKEGNKLTVIMQGKYKPPKLRKKK
jgi:hypothetical protein